MAFLGGSGEELEIPEESTRDLQNVKVSDQYYRETTGDFLDVDALKLMEQHSERKHTKSKSRAHRKTKRYHQKKKEMENKETVTENDTGATENVEGATNNKNYIDNEITKYLLGATNLAKPRYNEYQTVLQDIDEVSSSKNNDSKTDCRRKSNDPVTAVMDLPPESSDVVVTQEENQRDKIKQESAPDYTLSFQEETEWEVLCEKLQNYTFDGDEQS